MHTVELYELAVRTAEGLGYIVRQEYLGGVAGGPCVIAGRKYIFVDLTLSPYDQLEQLTAALADDPAIHIVEVPSALRKNLGLRAAA